MRIVIERRVEMADQGTSERRIEIEIDVTEEKGRIYDPVFIASRLLDALDERVPNTQ